MANTDMSTQIESIPFHGQTIQSVMVDGKPHVVVRPLVESLGLDADSQMKRLRRHSWACPVKMTVQVGGQGREVTMIDLRTLTMWLATIDENRVSEDARPLVVAYQSEVADAIEAYWTRGGVINPRATETQVNDLISEAQRRLELCQAAKGLIHADHLEAKARVILARGLGEVPELDEKARPVYASDFLKEKGLSGKQMKSVAPNFGKRLKAAYVLEHGKDPEQYPLDLPNGQTRLVNAYTAGDRPLMERVWTDHFDDQV